MDRLTPRGSPSHNSRFSKTLCGRGTQTRRNHVRNVSHSRQKNPKTLRLFVPTSQGDIQSFQQLVDTSGNHDGPWYVGIAPPECIVLFGSVPAKVHFRTSDAVSRSNRSETYNIRNAQEGFCDQTLKKSVIPFRNRCHIPCVFRLLTQIEKFVRFCSFAGTGPFRIRIPNS
jgi:hypothetical protein